MTALKFTVGTHNLHDAAGKPTIFADLQVFTEAVPAKIRARLRGTPFRMAVCHQQRDLVVVWDRRVFRRQRLVRLRYAKYVDGWAKVTPNRGTFTVPLIHRKTGRKIRVNAEHRINAAFKPFIRGEASFRANKWSAHTKGTLGIMRRQDKAGHLVLSAGDDNTPRGVHAYPGWNEAGDHFDRIGSNARLSHADELSREGSDHPRIRATLTEEKP